MVLPCYHQERVTQQIRPTANLLTNLDELHPDVLRMHDIEPADYKGGLVFRSAIESIRGSFIASSITGRQTLVGATLERLKQSRVIDDYKQTSTSQRCDFHVGISRDPDYFAALEVKGGEGNSINISDRPIWAREFCVWCHLDGAIVNQPAKGAHSILNRLTNEMIRRKKHVDVLFFKDILCGTRARPCPKYVHMETQIGLDAAPDVFLFPVSIPTLDNPEPAMHTLEDTQLPRLVLDLFGVETRERARHVWEVRLSLSELPNRRIKRVMQVVHQGEVVDESSSRPWQQEE